MRDATVRRHEAWQRWLAQAEREQVWRQRLDLPWVSSEGAAAGTAAPPLFRHCWLASLHAGRRRGLGLWRALRG